MNENTTTEGEKMIAQTYCGGMTEYDQIAEAASKSCGPEHGACPSCLREHVARLEARVGELEAELKGIRDATAWLSNVDPDEIKDEEMHSAALIDFRRWERISRQPGAVGNRVYHFEDFLVTHAREQGRRAALVEAEAVRVVPDDDDAHEELRENTESILAECSAEWAEQKCMDGSKAAMESQIKILWRAYNDLRSRLSALPASRVLKEGERAVSADVLTLCDKALASCSYAPQHVLREAIQSALRTQPTEGGA